MTSHSIKYPPRSMDDARPHETPSTLSGFPGWSDSTLFQLKSGYTWISVKLSDSSLLSSIPTTKTEAQAPAPHLKHTSLQGSSES